MLAEVRKILALHDKGILSEVVAEEQIIEYVKYATDNEAPCPIIDVFGLGPNRDPDAYEIGGKPKYPFHHLL